MSGGLQYSLQILFSPADIVTVVQSGYQLCLSKGSGSGSVQNPLPLIWVSKTPFEENTFSWTEQYDWYASNTEVQAGVTIEQESQTTNGIQLNVPYQFIYGAFQIG